jgi:hypothetical protein
MDDDLTVLGLSTMGNSVRKLSNPTELISGFTLSKYHFFANNDLLFTYFLISCCRHAYMTLYFRLTAAWEV